MMTNKELVKRVGGINASAVAQAVRRRAKRIQDDARLQQNTTGDRSNVISQDLTPNYHSTAKHSRELGRSGLGVIGATPTRHNALSYNSLIRSADDQLGMKHRSYDKL